MRLGIVENGHKLGKKAILLLMRVFSGFRAPDVVRTLFYRPELFGDSMSEWTNAILRGPSQWTVGEREIFAAFTSKLNQCVF